MRPKFAKPQNWGTDEECTAAWRRYWDLHITARGHASKYRNWYSKSVDEWDELCEPLWVELAHARYCAAYESHHGIQPTWTMPTDKTVNEWDAAIHTIPASLSAKRLRPHTIKP